MTKTIRPIAALAFLGCLFAGACSLRAQGTAFTYQGRLQNGTTPANGFYDLTFGVWTEATGASQVGATITNFATGITNGLLTMTLDFGSGVFDGNPRWLEISVRTNGGALFTVLSPRQLLAATPYALHASTVEAAGITGTIPAEQIGSGTITASNIVTLTASVTNLNVDKLTAGSMGGGCQRIGQPQPDNGL